MSAALIYKVDGQTHHVELKTEDVTLGRSPSCTIPLKHDTEVSRVHCSIQQRAKGSYVLLDAASRNGTFLNNRRCLSEEMELKDGDRILIGRTHLTFIKDGGTASTQDAMDDLLREMSLGKGFGAIMQEIVEPPPPVTQRGPEESD